MSNRRFVDTKQLHYFVVVVEAGGINRASKILNTVQPGVTSRIKAMEQHLGVTLLNRTAHGVEPTPEGMILYKRAKHILRELDAALAEVSAAGRSPSGRVRLAVSYSTSIVLSVPIAEAVMKSLPDAQFSIITGTNADNLERLMQDDVELAIATQDMRSPKLIFQPIVEEELFLVVPAASQVLRGRDSVRAAEVTKLPLIIGTSRYPSFGMSEVQRQFAQASISLQVKSEMPSLSGILDLVVATDSVAVLPWAGVAREEASGLVRRIRVEDIALRRTLALAWSASRPMSTLMGFVSSAIRSRIADLIREGGWKHATLIE